MKQRVVVIGAGPGGLAAGMLLGQTDLEVTILERQPHVGGRSASIQSDGFTFDTGPTFFLYPRVLEEIFRACGRELQREIEMTRLDPMYRVQFEGGEVVDATSCVERMQAQIAAFSPHDAANLPFYLAENRNKLERFRPVLERHFDSVRDLLAPELLRALPQLKPWSSVDRDLTRWFDDPRTRLIFSFQTKYLGMSPFRCPSLFTILAFLEYEHGVFHPTGGCGALMEKMAELVVESGVDLRLNEPVTEILFEGRRAVGVRTAERVYPADAVVINADFAHAMSSLVPNHLRRRWSDAKLAQKRYSCSTFMLYLGLDGDLDVEHHTIFLADEYRRNIAEIEGGALSAQPSFYVQNACRTDPSLAPPGCSTLYALVPVPNLSRPLDWRDAQAYRARTIARLENALGIRDLEKRIRVEKMLSPRDWEQQLGVYKGATFNLTHSMDQMLHRRPRNRFEEFDGIYLVGGGTHPGSGLPVIFESARISTRLMQQDLEFRASWEANSSPREPSGPMQGAMA
ncbi:phytoene desaturase family protein [Roseiterribacter gracilis]|uniref:Phytoene desaturase n=1 Tax=Roseiterribacter gracilis TaxID=2812848 RepID=A0A8S8XFF3_9PROT|nr:phytoene desaturase [Rhodospirillales bacterium TMPK1]